MITQYYVNNQRYPSWGRFTFIFNIEQIQNTLTANVNLTLMYGTPTIHQVPAVERLFVYDKDNNRLGTDYTYDGGFPPSSTQTDVEMATFNFVAPYDENGDGYVKVVFHAYIGSGEPMLINQRIINFPKAELIKTGRTQTRRGVACLVERMATRIGNLTESDPVQWAYYQFPTNELMSYPFLIYYFDGNDDFDADNINYMNIENLVIELYSDNVDFDAEACVETELTEHFLNYTKTFTYVEDEEMYLTRYESEILISYD